MSEADYLSVEQRDVLNVGVLDNVHYPRVLSDASHADAVGAVAPQVLHEDIGGVRLRGKAVVAHVHPRVGDTQAFDVVRIEAVRVFGKGLYHQTYSLAWRGGLTDALVEKASI